MNNKIIEVQEILFKEMKRLDDDRMLEFVDNRKALQEFERATALYNMSTGFIKSLNANITIMNLAKKNDVKYEELMKQLGINNEE